MVKRVWMSSAASGWCGTAPLSSGEPFTSCPVALMDQHRYQFKPDQQRRPVKSGFSGQMTVLPCIQMCLKAAGGSLLSNRRIFSNWLCEWCRAALLTCRSGDSTAAKAGIQHMPGVWMDTWWASASQPSAFVLLTLSFPDFIYTLFKHLLKSDDLIYHTLWLYSQSKWIITYI